MIKPELLPAGATLLHERRRDSPSFALSIWFPFGSRNEAPQARGFVHFVEHMLFKGTLRRDAFDLWRRIEGTGGYANGFTDRDGICVYCCVPSSEWRLAASLMAEAAFASSFPEAEFEREKQVILAEILQIEDDVEETAFDQFLAKFWPGHPAASPIAGSCDEVKRIGREPLLGFYREAFAPRSAVIAVSGDVDGAELASVLDEDIARASDLASAGRGRPAPPGPSDLIDEGAPSPAGIRGYTRASSSQIYYFDALQLDSHLDPRDYYGLSAVNGILGEASTSRLFQKVRERLGLAYTVQSSLSFSKTEAVIAIQAITGDDKFVECVGAIEDETRKLFADGLPANELAEAKSRLAGSFALAMEDPEARVRRLANWYLTAGVVPDAEEEKAACLGVRAEDAERLIAGLAAAPRGRYAYGNIKKATAKALSLKEMNHG